MYAMLKCYIFDYCIILKAVVLDAKQSTTRELIRIWPSLLYRSLLNFRHLRRRLYYSFSRISWLYLVYWWLLQCQPSHFLSRVLKLNYSSNYFIIFESID